MIVGKWSEPGIPIAGGGHGDAGRPRPPRPRSADRATVARGGADDPDMSPRLAARLKELGVTSLVAAPITRVRLALGRGRRLGHRGQDVRGRRRGPDQRVREPRRRRARERRGARAGWPALAEGRAALSRVAVAVATATRPESRLRRRHRGGRSTVPAERGQPHPLRPAERERRRSIVGRWSDGRAPGSHRSARGSSCCGGAGHARSPHRASVERTRRRPRDVEPELVAAPDASSASSRYVAAPIEVSGELWGAVVMSR